MISQQEKLDSNIKESWFSKIGVQKPYTVFVCIVAIIILGIFAFSSMKVDLFPDMNLPYALVVVSPNQEALEKKVAALQEDPAALSNKIVLKAVANAQKAGKEIKPTDEQDLRNILATYYDDETALEQQLGAVAGNNVVVYEYLQLMANPMQTMLGFVLPDITKMDALNQAILASLSVISGVSKTQSTTMVSVGTTIIMLEYDSDATVDTAALLLALDSVGLTNELKFGATFDKQIMKLDPSMLPIMGITVSFDGKDDAWFANNVLNKIKATTGVGEVSSNISTSEVDTSQDEAWEGVGDKLVKTRSIAIQKSSNATTTDVATSVIKTLETIKSENPGFTYEITSSQAEYINQSIGSVGENLIIGGILALLILFLFLRSVKMTLAIGISIPLAVVGTFVVMYFMGIGLNIVSMSGLALAVGMLVDNSVVVLENIYRLRSKGMSIKEAAIKGASQIMAAMLASALTTICVFFPMFFLEGMVMEVFTDLVWVVILSLSCSLLVAIMFLPSIVATFKIDAKQPKAVNAAKPSWWQKFKAGTNKVFDKVLNFAINKKWLTVALALILFVGSAALMLVNGFILMPATDSGSFSITATLSTTGSGKDKKAELADPMYAKITELLGGDLDKCVVEYVSGTDAMSMINGASESITVDVKLKDKRKLSTEAASDLVYQALQDFQTADYEEITVASASMTSGLVADDVSVIIASGKGDITAALADLDNVGHALVAKFDDVTIKDLKIKTVAWDENLGVKINKVDNKNVVVFTVKAYAGADSTKIQSKLNQFVKEVLASDAFKDQDLSVIDDGVAKQMAETYSSMGIALIVGFLLIYLVMVAIFQSFLMPAIILICVPLGFTGAFIALFLCGMPLSIPALIGFLILMGVVINNGILAVDYTNQARRDGLSVKDALVAAMHTRMRPIFMTALTTILALVPMALGISFFNAGGSTALMQPLAVVSIGGLLFGTMTTLLVVPAFYAIFCRDKKVKVAPETPVAPAIPANTTPAADAAAVKPVKATKKVKTPK